MLALFRRRADAGAAVVASLHDATLAARYADDVLLLFGDGRWVFGPCEDALTPEVLTELYASPMHEIGWRNQRIFVNG
jgi:iron complex transport system ATP-binding protein